MGGKRRPTEPRARRALPAWVALLVVPAVLLAPALLGHGIGPAVYQHGMLPWGEWQPQTGGPGWNALAADWVLQYYPWRAFAAESIRAGEIPLWNPWQLCGMPFQANGQSALLYPPNALFWLLPLPAAFAWGALLHLVLAGVLTYGCARRELGLSPLAGVLAGIAYQACGFLLAWTPMTAAMNVLAWLPGALWAAGALVTSRGRAWPWLGLVGAAMLLAGHLQFAYYGFLLALAYGLTGALVAWRTTRQLPRGILTGLALGVGGALVLAAAQVLPTMDLAAVNHRPAERSPEALRFLHDWALHRVSAAGIVSMAPYGSPADGTWKLLPQNFAEICGVTGTATVLLAAVGLTARREWRRWFLVAIAGVCLLVAFATPFANALYWLLPGFSRFAGLPRILCLWSLAVALLGGCGIDALPVLRADAKARAVAHRAMLAAIAVAVTVVLASALELTGLGAAPSIEALLRFSVIAAVSVAGIAAAMRQPVERWLPVVVAGELLLTGWGLNRGFAPEELSPPNPAIEALRAESERGRVLCVSDRWTFQGPKSVVLPPNLASALRIRDVQGYDSLMPTWIKHGAAQMGSGVASPDINGNMVMLGERDPTRLVPEAIAERGVSAVLAGTAVAEKLEHSGGFVRERGLGSCVLLRPANAPKPIPVHEGPNRMVSRDRPTDSPELVRESWDRGWVARVGERPVPTRLDPITGFTRVEGVAQSEEIRLSYEPGPFAVGSFLSMAACAVLVGLGVFRRGGGSRGRTPRA